MDHADAVAFADGWAKAWNSHDLEKVLSHFADDVVFTSPVAAQFLDNSDGVLRGKAALRAYWAEGLRRIPDLHFEVVGVYVGVHTLAINYRNQLGRLVNEVLIFDGSLVTQGLGTYLGSDANPAGGDVPLTRSWPANHGLVIGHRDAAPYNAVWRDGRVVGFVDWDTAGPSSREVDLAFVALSWVPLHARRVVEGNGFTAFDDRSRRLHLVLDAYGYSGDRSAFGAAVAARARRNAAGIHRLAAGGDPMYVALLPGAADLEQAAREVEALPASFWLRPGRSGYRRGPV